MRTALVTGGARGIGDATVRILCRRGVYVFSVDVEDPTFESSSHTFVRGDLTDRKFREALPEQCGPIDILINNAAVFSPLAIEDVSVDQFNHIISVNLEAVFFLCQLFAPAMYDRGWGRIVNVASVAARMGGLPGSSVYAASKAGVVAMTLNMARTYGSRGVTVNALAPGCIDTPMSAKVLTDEMISGVALRRAGTPAEVASVIAFLASDAASFVTGATIDVNGGWFMG